MKYLPILEELFESDTVIFLLVGLLIAFFTDRRFGNQKQTGIGAGVSALIYMGCELLLFNIRGNFLTEILLLFFGTISVGCFIGFLICCIVRRIKSRCSMI